jgi:hypothetical protein
MKRMGRKMRQRLEVIWAKGTPITEALPSPMLDVAPDRYVPMALGMGPGWGVWDRRIGRHLTDAEVARTSMDDLRDEKWTQ